MVNSSDSRMLITMVSCGEVGGERMVVWWYVNEGSLFATL